jgi:hypothetical protein
MAASKPKGFIMAILQLALGIVSLLMGLANLSKESAPIVHQMLQQQSIQRVNEQSIQYAYRYSDGNYRYYSDNSGHYWSRVNIQGVVEYARVGNDVVVR